MLIGLFAVCLAVIACSSGDQKEEAGQQTSVKEEASTRIPTITIMTHDSFSVSKGVMEAFETQVKAKMVILKSGDAGEALNKAILSKNNPLADLFYGVDNTFLSRALTADIFIPYAPAGLENVDASMKLDPENRLIPVDFGDVCLNYDIGWFKEKNIMPPAGLEDLIKPEYKGLTVLQNPATSSPGLAFLLATVSRFGRDGYMDFWQQLKSNGVLVTSGWKEAYWGQFTAASEGDRPIVVSYATSPAAEVYFSEGKLSEPPTGIVNTNGSAFRQIEFAGILKGTSEPDLAKKTMDFIMSRTFQEDIPLQMFVFPANRSAALPDVFVKHAVITEAPARLAPEEIDARRDNWIREWTEKILQ